jgi:MoxR-like ATPase
VSTPDPRHVAAPAEAILDEVERAVVGKREVLGLVLLALLADGHVLLEDVPGVAKTLIARCFAAATGLRFARVQFTPDLLPSDITGSSVFDQRAASFAFHPGPVFCNLLLGDEINRAPPKTQAALLEAMEEHQVTADDGTHPLERPFLVLATQNPIEYEGTYPLPEAQLDRFLVRLRVGYPAADDEWRMLDARARRGSEAVALKAIVDRDGLLTLQAAVEAVHVGEAVGRYMVALTTATRESSEAEVGASPRGSLALLRLARARAAVEGRDYVVPDDVKAVAVPALAHRLVLRPELWVRRIDSDAVVRRLLDSVPAPPAMEPADHERQRLADPR